MPKHLDDREKVRVIAAAYHKSKQQPPRLLSVESARAAYLEGRIDVHEFEGWVERALECER